MGTVVAGGVEWEAAKAHANRRKHGVSFEEAATVLADPHVALFDDGSGARTFKAIGLSRRGRPLTVVHEPRERRDRIISAWRSTAEERRLYMADR